MLRNIKLKTERFLYKKGFTDAPLRDIILSQLVLLVVSFALGLLALPLTSWMMVFFVGAALLSFNFWNISRFVLARIPAGYSAGLAGSQLVRFLGRIFITGLILTAVIIAGGSILALSLGLLSCLIVISIVALVRFSGRGN